MKKHFLVLGLLAATAVPASAEGVYIFGDAGQSKFSVDFDGASLSETDTSFAFGVGYAINKTFSFEAAYRDLGGISSDDEYGESQFDMSALQASVVAAFPIGSAVNIFGRLGLAQLSYDSSYEDYEDSDYDESDSDSANKAVYGVGASYTLNENVSLRAEYNKYAEWDGLTTSAFTLGAVYSF